VSPGVKLGKTLFDAEERYISILFHIKFENKKVTWYILMLFEMLFRAISSNCFELQRVT